MNDCNDFGDQFGRGSVIGALDHAKYPPAWKPPPRVTTPNTKSIRRSWARRQVDRIVARALRVIFHVLSIGD